MIKCLNQNIYNLLTRKCYTHNQNTFMLYENENYQNFFFADIRRSEYTQHFTIKKQKDSIGNNTQQNYYCDVIISVGCMKKNKV